MSIQCPACGAANPDHSWQCACGHYFVTTMPKTPGSAEAAGDTSAGADFASSQQSQFQGQPPNEVKNWRLVFRGQGDALFGIYIVNLLLTLLTLGIYYFWGKVKVRNYTYSQTEFEGDRFAYHGTGKELLIGWLKAILILGLLLGLFFAIVAAAPGAAELLSNLYSALFYMVLLPIAIVGSRRYRLSRTSWRGIRFSFRGHAEALINIFVRDSILTGLTLGIYYPYFQNHLRKFLVSNVYFGNRGFDYDGEGGDLWRIYAVGIFFTICTLGVYYFWFSASKARYYWERTTFSGSRGLSTVTGWNLAKLKIGNLLLIVFTLGLGYPWTVVRSLRFDMDNIHFYGSLDLNVIQQEAMAASATGEGFTEMLDAGMLDIDLGF